MIIQPTTLIISISIILLAFVTPFFNPFFRWKRIVRRSKPENENDTTNESLPPVSIVITTHDNAQELVRNLSSIINQDYPTDFQVIVVMEKGDNETEDVLKRYADNKHLYTTFIPDSSRYMSRKKLAVTLGVKAAKHEWIVLMEAFCVPTSEKWLETLAHNFQNDKHLVIGYTGFDDETPDYYKFERLRTFCYTAREAIKGTTYRSCGHCVSFRKSDFMAANGYSGNLHLIRGEYDFLVNKYAQRGTTGVETAEEAWLREESPSLKTWRNDHLFYLETRKFLKRSRLHRALYNIDMWLMYGNYVAICVAFTYGIIDDDWVINASAGAALLITLVTRTIFAHQVTTQFNENIGFWKIIPYELSLIWHSATNRLRYLSADKNDFTSHKL
ncbi:glycosyltransferase [Hoylesella enoeca]|nr:glycosyltransferase [Hoylesella enoeca]